MNKNIYLKLRLERQHFTKPAGKKEYGVLFKQMSPVLCVYWSCPGSPPELYTARHLTTGSIAIR